MAELMAGCFLQPDVKRLAPGPTDRSWCSSGLQTFIHRIRAPVWKGTGGT